MEAAAAAVVKGGGGDNTGVARPSWGAGYGAYNPEAAAKHKVRLALTSSRKRKQRCMYLDGAANFPSLKVRLASLY